ncbi:hypothetical protein P7C70_g2986, partial [Phenoliferia sp. Uapishka_3]
MHFPPSPPTTATSESSIDVLGVTDSTDRFVLPLAAHSTEELSEESEMSSKRMLRDYLSRLGRYEPRLRSYLSAKSDENREPVRAFMGGPPGTVTPLAPPAPLGAATHAAGFSLLDLERWVLSKWRGSEATSGTTRALGHRNESDHEGLDVDLSQVFVDQAAGTRAGGATDSLLLKQASPGRFLNYYSSASLIQLLETEGILRALASRGFTHPSLVFDVSDDFQHRLSLVDSSLFAPEIRLLSSECFLIDLYMKRRRCWNTDSMVCYQLMKRLEKAGSWEKLRERTGEIRAPFVGVEGAKEVAAFFETNVPKFSKLAKKGSNEWDVSELVWMQMHNPFAPVTRPLLPGQRFPGLGIGRVGLDIAVQHQR